MSESAAPEVKVEAGVPQERITGDILRGRGPRRGNLEALLKYWRPIMRKPGGFRRCLVILADHPELYPLERICAWLHHETTGKWPNEKQESRRFVARTSFVSRGPAEPDVSLDRLLVHQARDTKGLWVQPIAGRPDAIDFKASRVTRAAVSVLLPGERGLVGAALVPGGGSNPGRAVPGGSSGLGRAIGGGRAAAGRLRCPAGYENGGQFTNRSFSNCGRQIFDLPTDAPERAQLAAARAVGASRVPATIAEARQFVGETIGDAAFEGRAPRIISRAAQIPPPGEFNQKRQAQAVGAAVDTASSAKGSFIRVVRADGFTVRPTISMSRLARISRNPSMADAVVVTNVLRPDKLGENELGVLRTGARGVVFALPGGSVISIGRKKRFKLGDAGNLAKRVAAIRKAAEHNDYAAHLKKLVDESNDLTYAEEFRGIKNAHQLLQVESTSGERRVVPKWVYELFLAPKAPGRRGGKTFKLVGPVKKEKEGKSAQGDRPFEQEPPQRPSALPISRGLHYRNLIDYKAASWVDNRALASWVVSEKAARALWDPEIGRYRCPPGLTNGGQITNRFGEGCGAGVARRAIGAVRRAGRAALGAVDGPDTGARTARRVDRPAGGGVRERVGRAVQRAADRVDPSAPAATPRPRRQRREDNDRNFLQDLRRVAGELLEGAGDRVDDTAGREEDRRQNPNRERRRRVGLALLDFAERLNTERGNEPLEPSRGQRPRVRPNRTRRPVADSRQVPEGANERQLGRVRAAIEQELDKLEQLWAQRLGRGDFDEFDIDRYLRNRSEGRSVGRVPLEALHDQRDDWADLRELVDQGDGVDAEQINEVLGRLNRQRANLIRREADLDRTERGRALEAQRNRERAIDEDARQARAEIRERAVRNARRWEDAAKAGADQQAILDEINRARLAARADRDALFQRAADIQNERRNLPRDEQGNRDQERVRELRLLEQQVRHQANAVGDEAVAYDQAHKRVRKIFEDAERERRERLRRNPEAFLDEDAKADLAEWRKLIDDGRYDDALKDVDGAIEEAEKERARINDSLVNLRNRAVAAEGEEAAEARRLVNERVEQLDRVDAKLSLFRGVRQRAQEARRRQLRREQGLPEVDDPRLLPNAPPILHGETPRAKAEGLGVIGEFDENGLPVPKAIENPNITDVDQAVEFLRNGGSLAEVPNQFWMEAVSRNSSFNDVDLDNRFLEIRKNGGIIGDTRIFALRDENGVSTGQGWVFKAAAGDENLGELLGWATAAGAGFGYDVPGWDGKNARGLQFVAIPFAHNALPEGEVEGVNQGGANYDAFLFNRFPDRGLPARLQGFLHNYALQVADRHDGNGFTFVVDGKPYVLPIDLGWAFHKGRIRSPEQFYSLDEYGRWYSMDRKLFDKIKSHLEATGDVNQARAIVKAYDDYLTNARKFVNIDLDSVVEKLMTGWDDDLVLGREDAQRKLGRLAALYATQIERLEKDRRTILRKFVPEELLSQIEKE